MALAVPEDGEQVLARQSTSKRLSARAGSMATTAMDIVGPSAEDLQDNHERSQMMFQKVLQYREIATDRCKAPFMGGTVDEMDQRRYQFTHRVFDELKFSGVHAFRTLRVLLESLDDDKLGICSCHTFVGQLNCLGVRLKQPEMQELLDLFACEHLEHVNYALFVAFAYSNWSAQREELVKDAYERLCHMCSGNTATVSRLKKEFRPIAMTEDLVPNLGDQGAQEFFHQWFDGVLHSDGSITWLDFLDYYLDVSAFFTSEQEFCDFVCKSWGIDMDDLLAKRLFYSFATSDLDDVLLLHEFTAMIQEIDSTITDTEANAWYRDINERDNGTMSLQEFLSSKVLLVIRLFNEFGEGQRKLSYKQMGLLLRTLNSKMAEDEIAVVCAYADLDDNGIISLDMFLKQHLLTVLKIFDDFNVNGDRLMTEVQLKALLHKMDPDLGDREITNVYKAIDVDGSGEIDFTEFLQSQVMRAKSLFDHYDTDKRKSLTRFKFRELLLDIDDSLDQTELEALYNLAADPVLDRVTLAGFLSPNIVKLKRLFDKYDKDRSKLLDVSEYRDMLKELFSDMQDDDVEILLETALPEGGDQEISLVAYIENYKAIAYKHDTLTLSRFLEAKKKAKRRGLLFDPKNPFPASPRKEAIGNGMVGE